MGTNLTQAHSSGSGAAQAAAKETVVQQAPAAGVPLNGERKPTGYGLPCSKCHLYYPADVDVCPTCKHNERVSPVVPKKPSNSVQAAGDPIPDNEILEQEREEFLRHFKAQLREAHADAADAPAAICKLSEHHLGETSPAEICPSCYERLQERVDVYEGALHMELKEAAQIIYDAVWSDPSDPGKTYQNAANALLTELRKRAGVTAVFGPFQPLTH